MGVKYLIFRVDRLRESDMICLGFSGIYFGMGEGDNVKGERR